MDGKRPPQTYYFEGVNAKDPNAPIVDGLVEQIMCRKAVKNMIRFLMVKKKEESPSSVQDFFGLSVKKYIPNEMEQLQYFGTILNSKAKAKWAAPELQNVIDLEEIGNLIPTVISSLYEDIAGGGVGYYSTVVRKDRQGTRL